MQGPGCRVQGSGFSLVFQHLAINVVASWSHFLSGVVGLTLEARKS